MEIQLSRNVFLCISMNILFNMNFYFKTMDFKRKSLAFTLIEMMITLSIVTLLTTMVLVYSRQSESVTNLIRDSDRLLFNLRQVQSSSMLTLQQSTGSSNVCGWGIYINKDALPQAQYILFNDFCNTGTRGQYDSGEDLGEGPETINLLKGVEIKFSDIKSVVFVPPEPQIKVSFDGVSSQTLSNTVDITMCLEADSNNCFVIHITPAGQIYKEKL